MQKLLWSCLLILPFFAFISTTDRSAEPKQKYYYFCFSREVPIQEEANQKLQFVYTDMHELVGDEQDIYRLTHQFGDYIHQQCKSSNELCTSDLNYYQDSAQAQKRYKEILAKYEQMGNYDMKRIDFQFN